MKPLIIASSVVLSITSSICSAADPRADLLDALGSSGATLIDTATESASEVVDAGSDRLSKEIRGRESVKVDDLRVEIDNVIHGKVEADEESHIYVGDVEFENVDLKNVDVTIDNELHNITADDGSTVSIGNASLTNMSGNKVFIDTHNEVQGNIKATDDSTVSIGNTRTE